MAAPEPSWASLLFSKEAVHEAISGAVADTISSSILFPMDVLKTKTQANSKITALDVIREALKEGNLLSLWAGVESKLYTSPQQKLQYFYVFNILKGLYIKRYKKEPN